MHSKSAVTAVAWSPDGTKLVTGSDDGEIVVWSGIDGERISSLAAGQPDGCEYLAWRRDGTRIVAGGKRRFVVVWDGVSEEPLCRSTTPTYDEGNCVWGSDDNRVVCGAKALHFTPFDGDCVSGYTPWREIARGITAVTCSPNGDDIAFSAVEAETPGGAGPFTHRAAPVVCLRRGGEDTTIVVDDLSRHDTLAFSRSGEYLAIGGTGGLLHVWNVFHKTTVFMRRVRGTAITSIAWSPDNNRVAIGTAYGFTRIVSVVPQVDVIPPSLVTYKDTNPRLAIDDGLYLVRDGLHFAVYSDHFAGRVLTVGFLPGRMTIKLDARDLRGPQAYVGTVDGKGEWVADRAMALRDLIEVCRAKIHRPVRERERDHEPGPAEESPPPHSPEDDDDDSVVLVEDDDDE
jgi:hypothetical protein